MTKILEKNLETLLKEIDDSRQSILLRIYQDYKELFYIASGSSHNHQAWKAGYADHIAECLRINDISYDALEKIRPLPFSKASAAISLFLHDIEKPFRYGPKENKECNHWQTIFTEQQKDWEDIKWDILKTFKKTYSLVLTDEENNALKYTHGEGSKYRKDMRIALPLAAHVHHCDNISARIWHDKGQNLA